jgi:hypothetical protein
VQIVFPQPVELQHVEISSTDDDNSSGSFQVYGRIGECPASCSFVELTEGPTRSAQARATMRLDAKGMQTEHLTVIGGFHELTVRAVGEKLRPV